MGLDVAGAAWRKSYAFARQQPLGFAGALILAATLVMATFGPLLVGDPALFRFDERLLAPSWAHPLGTDGFGRDVLARIVVGARTEVIVTVAAVVLGSGSGAILGLISGYYGGKVDDVIQRVVDALMAFPVLVLALAIVAVMGAGAFSIIVAISVPLAARSSRVVRATALSVKSTEFVMAARAIGGSGPRIMRSHIAPQCFAPFVVISTAMLGIAILAEAALSYLGFGPPPPSVSWGGMLSSDATEFFRKAWWIAVFPGVAISLLVFAVNMLGDTLRDVTDPRLRNLVAGGGEGLQGG